MTPIVRLLSRPALLLAIAAGLASCSITNPFATPTPPTPTPELNADAICHQYDTSITALTPPVTDFSSPADASELPQLATWLGQVIGQAQQEQAALQGEPTAASIKAPFGITVANLQAAQTAAANGDLPAYKLAWTNYITSKTLFAQAGQAAGLPFCD